MQSDLGSSSSPAAAPPRSLTPLTLRSRTLPSRFVVAPMCQYMANDGLPHPWHLVHLGSLACGGFGLVTVEATAVLPEGRITPQCLGLWSDEHERALAELVRRIRAVSDAPLGIQIAHAGRKASTRRPFLGGQRGPVQESEGGWRAVAPSPVPFGSLPRKEPTRAPLPAPRELDAAELPVLAQAFATAAERAARIGFDYCEVHAAHGYLLASFLSPLSNHRRDRYGGPLEARFRFPLEVVERVRAAWPHDRPLGVRFGGSDWAEGGWSIDDASRFARELAARGVDILSVSTAGNAPVEPRSSPGWLLPHAREIRRALHAAEPGTHAAVTAVGELDDPHLAERALADGDADLVAMARGALRDPRFPWRAARTFGLLPRCPAPYAWAVGT